MGTPMGMHVGIEIGMARRGARRTMRAGLAGVATALAAASLGLIGPARLAAAEVPRPLTPIAPLASPGAFDLPNVPFNVLGETSAHQVFVSLITPLGNVAVVEPVHHAVVLLGVHLDRPGPVGPDGRLWGGEGTAVRAVAADGTHQDVEVSLPGQGEASTPGEVTVGSDGRIWFLVGNSTIGAVQTDGSGSTTWPAGGTAAVTRLAVGPDGAMWFTRNDGTVARISATGTVTEVAALSGPLQAPPRTFDGQFWTFTSQAFALVAADGTVTTIASHPALPADVQVAGGRLWALQWKGCGPCVPGPQLVSYARAGSAATVLAGRVATSVPIAYELPVADPLSGSLTPYFASLAPAADGGLLGSEAGHVWRWSNPAPDAQLGVSATLVHHAGYDALRLTASGFEAAGGAITAPATVARWSVENDSAYDERVVRTDVGSVSLAGGHGTGEVAVVPSMVAWSQGSGVHATVAIAIEIRRTSAQPGISSPLAHVPTLVLPPTMAQVAKINAYVLHRQGLPFGLPVDDAGALYWSKKLAAGTSRATLARSLTATDTWLRARVEDAYQRWLLRRSDKGGRDHWVAYLRTHTTQQFELAFASTAVARDAEGTSSYWRARHLAEALGTNRLDSYRAQLDARRSWTRILRAAYPVTFALDARAGRVLSGLQVANTTSSTTRAQVAAALARRGDERDAIALVAATLR